MSRRKDKRNSSNVTGAKATGARRRQQSSAAPRGPRASSPAALKRSPRVAVLVAGALVLLVIAGYAAVRWSGRVEPSSAGGGEVPRVENLSALDPAVAAAIRDAVAAVEREPSTGARWGELGIVYNAHRYYALAERCFERAQLLEPTVGDWPHLRGVLAEERGEVDAAAAHYRAALERAPADHAARYRLGGVLLAAGKVDESESAFTELASSRPAEPWGPLGLGRVALRRGASAEASRHFERALEIDPDHDQAAHLLASAYREQGNTVEASRLADRARDGVRNTMPPDPIVDRVRGALRSLQSTVSAANETLNAGNFEAAEAMYDAVLRTDPDHFDALLRLGMLYGRQQRFAEAEGVLERAVAVRPRDTQARMLLAVALLEQNEVEAGARELRRLLEHDPEHVLAARMLGDLQL